MPPKKRASEKPVKEETAEERAAQLQAEAIAEQEAARRRIEAAQQRLLERQQREQDLVRVNAPGVHAAWLERMRGAKLGGLRARTGAMAEDHERALDARDGIIQTLDRELEEAKEQQEACFRGHDACLGRLGALQAARLAAMQQRFGANLKALQEGYEQRRAEVAAAFADAQDEASAVQAAAQRDFQARAGDAAAAFAGAREEGRNRAAEELSALKLLLEAQIGDLSRQLAEAQASHAAATEDKAESLKELTEVDAKAAAQLAAFSKDQGELQEALGHWRAKALGGAREWDARNRALAAEKASLLRHHGKLKASLTRFRASQGAALKALSMQSAAAEAELAAELALGERILRLASQCAHHEAVQAWALQRLFRQPTEPTAPAAARLQPDEQPARPVHAGSAHAKLAARLSSIQEEEEAEEAAWTTSAARGLAAGEEEDRPAAQQQEQAVGRLLSSDATVAGGDGLDGFYCRINAVLLDKIGLGLQQQQMARSNAALRRQLRMLLEGIAVSGDAVRSPSNTLLIVNSSLQAALHGKAGVLSDSSRAVEGILKQAQPPKSRNKLAVLPSACLA